MVMGGVWPMSIQLLLSSTLTNTSIHMVYLSIFFVNSIRQIYQFRIWTSERNDFIFHFQFDDLPNNQLARIFQFSSILRTQFMNIYQLECTLFCGIGT